MDHGVDYCQCERSADRLTTKDNPNGSAAGLSGSETEREREREREPESVSQRQRLGYTHVLIHRLLNYSTASFCVPPTKSHFSCILTGTECSCKAATSE